MSICVKLRKVKKICHLYLPYDTYIAFAQYADKCMDNVVNICI